MFWFKVYIEFQFSLVLIICSLSFVYSIGLTLFSVLVLDLLLLKCGMIKRNDESDVADIVFEIILAKEEVRI